MAGFCSINVFPRSVLGPPYSVGELHFTGFQLAAIGHTVYCQLVAAQCRSTEMLESMGKPLATPSKISPGPNWGLSLVGQLWLRG